MNIRMVFLFVFLLSNFVSSASESYPDLTSYGVLTLHETDLAGVPNGRLSIFEYNGANLGHEQFAFDSWSATSGRMTFNWVFAASHQLECEFRSALSTLDGGSILFHYRCKLNFKTYHSGTFTYESLEVIRGSSPKTSRRKGFGVFDIFSPSIVSEKAPQVMLSEERLNYSSDSSPDFASLSINVSDEDTLVENIKVAAEILCNEYNLLKPDDLDLSYEDGLGVLQVNLSDSASGIAVVRIRASDGTFSTAKDIEISISAGVVTKILTTDESDVHVWSQGVNDNRRTLGIGDPVFYQDVVTTQNAAVTIEMDSGVIMSIGPESSIRVVKEQMQHSKSFYSELLDLFIGVLRVKTKASFKEQSNSFKVRTMNTGMGIRGTEFIVTVSESEVGQFTTELTVEEGEVEHVDLLSKTTKRVAAGGSKSVVGENIINVEFDWISPRSAKVYYIPAEGFTYYLVRSQTVPLQLDVSELLFDKLNNGEIISISSEQLVPGYFEFDDSALDKAFYRVVAVRTPPSL